MAPPTPGPPQNTENNPEICVTNVNDEIKFVFGGALSAVVAPSVVGSNQIQPEMAEPMDHS